MSAAGLELLKKSEGFRGRMYLDVAGVPTIGYGHRILATESFPNGIDEAWGQEMLSRYACKPRSCIRLISSAQRW